MLKCDNDDVVGGVVVVGSAVAVVVEVRLRQELQTAVVARRKTCGTNNDASAVGSQSVSSWPRFWNT